MRSPGKPNLAPAPAGAIVQGEFDDGGIVPARTAPIAQIRTSYVVAQAVTRLRDLKVVKERCLVEAELSGEDFYYNWPQGKGFIEGVSIDGAMILYRNYGNCVVEAQVVQEGPTFWLFDAVFIDLETGSTISRQFRQRKTESHQKVGKDGDADRLLDIAFQIGQSKAQRNVIVKALPAWLVNAAFARAKDSAAGKYADIGEWIANTLKAYEKLKVTKEELEKRVGRPVDAWTSDDIRMFQGLHRAIMARETTVAEVFRGAEPTAAPATTTTPAAPGSAPAAKPAPALEGEKNTVSNLFKKDAPPASEPIPASKPAAAAETAPAAAPDPARKE